MKFASIKFEGQTSEKPQMNQFTTFGLLIAVFIIVVTLKQYELISLLLMSIRQKHQTN